MSFGCVYSEKEERIMNMCYARHTLHDFVGAVNTTIAEILLRAGKPSDESMKAMKNFKLSALEAIGNAHLLTGGQDECMIELDDLEKKMKQKSEQYLFYRLLGVIFQRKETITDLEKAIQRTPEQLPFLERSLYPLFLRFGYDIMEDNRQADRTELIFYIQTILTDFDRLTEDKYFDKLNIKGREKYLSEWKACTQRALQLGIEFGDDSLADYAP